MAQKDTKRVWVAWTEEGAREDCEEMGDLDGVERVWAMLCFVAGRETCWYTPDLKQAHTSCGQLGKESSRANAHI